HCGSRTGPIPPGFGFRGPPECEPGRPPRSASRSSTRPPRLPIRNLISSTSIADPMSVPFPDDSNHEGYCRQVIGYETPLSKDKRGWELVQRLEAELREHLKNGTLQLPDAPAAP